MKHSINLDSTNTLKPDVAKPVIRMGSKGDQALQLQINLNYFGADIDEDGCFGQLSVQALKSWQLENSLVADGVYGAKSFEKMRLLLK